MAVIYDISRIDAMEGHEFEHFIATLLRKLGYENVEVTRGSGDQGVDVLAEKEGVRYAVQCKCYSSDLGNTPVQEVNTGKVIYHCHVGVVVTNRYFTQGAKEAAKATGVLLWDRSKLITLLAQAQMGTYTEIPAPQREENLTLWNGNPLLRRGGIALKDREWKKARQFFDRVLNTDPENAEAYLGLVMAEAEVSDKYEFMLMYSYNPMKLYQLNQNNLRHAKEFARDKLRAWLITLEAQQKDAEVQQKDAEIRWKEEEADKKLTKEQERKGLILAYLSANPELVVTAYDIMKKVLWPAYPGEIWSDTKAKVLLNALCGKEDKLIRVKDKSGKEAFILAEGWAKKQAALKSEQVTLQAELANLEGLFTGRRRREIEARLTEINTELNIRGDNNSMPRMPQIRIENSDGGYRFYIYPSNSNSIPMGRSTQAYQSYGECSKASDLFKSLVLENGLNVEDGKFVKIETGKVKTQAGDGYITTYRFLYFDEAGVCVFEGRSKYWRKQNCKKGIQSLFATINKA